jgi:hypothetical protein
MGTGDSSTDGVELALHVSECVIDLAHFIGKFQDAFDSSGAGELLRRLHHLGKAHASKHDLHPVSLFLSASLSEHSQGFL